MKKIVVLVAAIVLLLNTSLLFSQKAEAKNKVMWGSVEVSKGMIGKAIIIGDTYTYTLKKNKFYKSKKAIKGQEIKVFAYKNSLGGLYDIGKSVFLKKESKVKYVSLSKESLALLTSADPPPIPIVDSVSGDLGKDNTATVTGVVVGAEKAKVMAFYVNPYSKKTWYEPTPTNQWDVSCKDGTVSFKSPVLAPGKWTFQVVGINAKGYVSGALKPWVVFVQFDNYKRMYELSDDDLKEGIEAGYAIHGIIDDSNVNPTSKIFAYNLPIIKDEGQLLLKNNHLMTLVAPYIYTPYLEIMTESNLSNGRAQPYTLQDANLALQKGKDQLSFKVQLFGPTLTFYKKAKISLMQNGKIYYPDEVSGQNEVADQTILPDTKMIGQFNKTVKVRFNAKQINFQQKAELIVTYDPTTKAQATFDVDFDKYK
ncbi:MAG: hypothetical protein Q8906_16655 [Bacillota bacterium]|nr:hypothetical protein [Bacillota bacterium]